MKEASQGVSMFASTLQVCDFNSRLRHSETRRGRSSGGNLSVFRGLFKFIGSLQESACICRPEPCYRLWDLWEGVHGCDSFLREGELNL